MTAEILEAGAVIADRYRVVRLLGKGSYGVVYLVDLVQLPGAHLALKVLSAEAADETSRRRFEREVRIALKLDHPSIVTIREFSRDGARLCYAMDLVEGPTLGDVAKRDAMPLPRIVARTREVLEALGAAHDLGVVHRDVKPDNVILSGAGTAKERAKVLDFGVAAAGQDLAEIVSLDGGAIGTPTYMSPEQAAGERARIGPRSDLYSVGCILFELLAGRLPFESESALGFIVQHQTEPVPAMAEVAPDRRVPEALERVVRKALEKDPDDRFATADAMIAALDEAAAGCIAAGAPAPPLGPPQRFDGRARIDLPPGASPLGITTIFVVATDALRFGRAGAGQTDPGAPENTIVLRVMPCRSAALDPENHRRSSAISRSQGVIEVRDGRAGLVDCSRGWITLDDARIPKGARVPLPGSFRLGLTDSLTLEGRVTPPPGEGEPSAVLLRRVDNTPEHAYLWVRGRATLGTDLQAVLALAPPHRAEIWVDGAAISVAVSADLRAREGRPGEEAG